MIADAKVFCSEVKIVRIQYGPQLNRDAVLALSELWDRATNLNCADPEHYVFPACENGHIDPNRPMKGWRTAWRNLTEKAGLEGLRFHYLRHHAATELAEMPLSDQKIMSIAGHVSLDMLNHYSHIRRMAKRRAVESLETALPETQPVTANPVPEKVN